MRWRLFLALPIISACEGDKVPDEPAVAQPPQITAPSSPDIAEPALSAPDEPAAPADPVDSTVEPIEIEIELEPVAPGDADKLPSERTVPAPKAKPAATKKAVEDVELPDAELDLSLPDDWPEELDANEEQTSMSLLPPLFDSGRSPGSVQMSGELLPGAAQDDDMIDGAQINIEFKR